LNELDGPAYNFHPGPPAYPGSHPTALALYDRATHFGATLHEMVARVDSGPIVGTVDFRMPDGIGYADLARHAYQATIKLFLQAAPVLAGSDAPLMPLPIVWGDRRSTRGSIEAMCRLSGDIGPEELGRRAHAFGEVPGLTLTISLHGMDFVLRR
jgi:hypothetical protein